MTEDQKIEFLSGKIYMRKLEEKFRENTTLKYYNENATIFSATTQIVDFSITQDKFLALLQPNAYILDFGCGSGRDTKYFMEHGYRVEATDGSEELCKLASTYTRVSVKYMLFQELDEQKKYTQFFALAYALTSKNIVAICQVVIVVSSHWEHKIEW